MSGLMCFFCGRGRHQVRSMMVRQVGAICSNCTAIAVQEMAWGGERAADIVRRPVDWSDDRAIATSLRSILKQRKISISTAADKIGIPFRTLQNQLAGNNRMSASTFAKLISLLDLWRELA